MATKKLDNKPTIKTWIWLKGPKSKALEEMRSAYGTEKTKGLCGRWLEVRSTDSNGDHSLPDGKTMVLAKEVAHVQQSVECPKDAPAKVVRTKKAKAKTWKLAFKPVGPKVTKFELRQLLAEARQTAERLSAQVSKLRKKGTK